MKKKYIWNYHKCIKNIVVLFFIIYCIFYYTKTMTLYNRAIETNVKAFTEYAEKNGIEKNKNNYSKYMKNK